MIKNDLQKISACCLDRHIKIMQISMQYFRWIITRYYRGWAKFNSTVTCCSTELIQRRYCHIQQQNFFIKTQKKNNKLLNLDQFSTLAIINVTNPTVIHFVEFTWRHAELTRTPLINWKNRLRMITPLVVTAQCRMTCPIPNSWYYIIFVWPSMHCRRKDNAAILYNILD